MSSTLINLLPELDFKDPLRAPVFVPKKKSTSVVPTVLTPPSSRPVSPARMMFSELSIGIDKFGCHNLDDINVSDLIVNVPMTPPESPMCVPASPWMVDEKSPCIGIVPVPVLEHPAYDSFDSLLEDIVPNLTHGTPYATPYASDAEDMLFAFSPESSPSPQAVPERRCRSIKRPVMDDNFDDDDYHPSEAMKPRKRNRLLGNKRKGSRRARTRDMNSKRDSHNVSERHRRRELKLNFEALRTSVPCMADNPRVHTGTILNNALDFIRALEQEERELIAQKEALVEENARLKAARGI